MICQKFKKMAYLGLFLCFTSTSFAADCEANSCCKGMGGIQYCDSSAGRFVCRNGSYSACYCTKRAVMDLQHVAGCCTWQGGVMVVSPTGLVVCNNGAISEVCSIITTVQRQASPIPPK